MEEGMTRRIVFLVVVFLLFAVGSSVYTGSFEDGLDAYEKGDYVTAAREFRKAAEQGHADAQFMLELMYEIGGGVPKNYTEAVKRYLNRQITGF